MTFNDPVWLEEERRCLRALGRGDRAAFSRLYRAFAEPLYRRVLLPRLGDPDAAQDALADTFRVMVEKLEQYEDRGGSIFSWLATIAANRARDLDRDRARSGRALRGFEMLWAPLLETQAPGPAVTELDAAAERQRLQAAVLEVLRAINPRYRRALELRFIEEKSRVECASLLDVKLGTFDVLLLRALRAFRAQWQQSVGATAEAS